jgi:hypothetical protein
MDKLVGLIVDVIRKLFGRNLEPDSPEYNPDKINFLVHRKELSNIRIWILDIFEKNPTDEFTTSEIYVLIMPIIEFRTKAGESDFNQDGCYMRLEDLAEKKFLDMKKTHRGKAWIMSSSYREHFIDRSDDGTIFNSKDEEEILR